MNIGRRLVPWGCIQQERLTNGGKYLTKELDFVGTVNYGAESTESAYPCRQEVEKCATNDAMTQAKFGVKGYRQH